jgi:hypothetical protein
MIGGRRSRERFGTDGLVGSNPRDAQVECVDDASLASGRFDRGMAAADGPRRDFASGPAAREAAAMLHAALGLPAAVTVNARFDSHSIRCIDHRFSGRDGSKVIA